MFPALADVNAEVAQGEAVGIIGRNGSGKSTLLKILSRVTQPTTGRVELYGRVSSLLEVGTGFHPELTGRENIFLNGAILGMRRRDVSSQFDSIVEFADVARFLETPVKRYSTGMYVRLAFAVAAHLQPDILVVDEVLAVGDFEFQKKCLGKMGEVTSNEGRTVLFVSHNMAAVQSFCTRALHLEGGRVVFDGPTGEAIDHYLSSGAEGASTGNGVFDLTDVPRATKGRSPILQAVELRGGTGELTARVRMGDPLDVSLRLRGLEFPRHGVVVRARSDSDTVVFMFNTVMKPFQTRRRTESQDRLDLHLASLPLVPGRYSLEVTVLEGGAGTQKVVLDQVAKAATFEVTAADVYGSGFQMPSGQPLAGVVYVDGDWTLSNDGETVASTAASPAVTGTR